MVTQCWTVSFFTTRYEPIVIFRIQSKIHADMIDLRTFTLIRIEENEISNADLRKVFCLNVCIPNNHHTRGSTIYFEGSTWYGAMGPLWFQTERNCVGINVS